MIRIAKISLIVLTVMTMNFTSADLALAVAPPNRDEVLTRIDLSAANASPLACSQFRDKLMELTQKTYKAFWPGSIVRRQGLVESVTPKTAGPDVECTIVPSNFEDYPMTGNANIRIGIASDQPISARNLQSAIKESEAGISADTIRAAQLALEEEQNQASGVSRVIGWFINLIFSVVASVLGVVTALAGQILVVAIDWTTGSASPNIVEVGWGVVRDFANMFFILIMIVIGIAAILRLEQYDYKHLLGEVILMAILVNFSKIIAETIIQFSNFLVLLFYNFDFYEIFLFLQNVAWGGISDFSSGGWMSALVQGITKVIFMVVTCGVFLILAGMFTVRLVGLYVLVILSPAAYILDILPPTKNLAHDWWHKFIEYIVWAPVAMFMIKLSMLIVEGGGLQTASLVTGNSSRFAGISNDSVFNYVILTGFMVAAVLVAEHAGMVGGNTVVNGVEKAGHWLGHTVGGYVGRKWNEGTSHLLEQHGDEQVSTRNKVLFTMLNPVAAFKGSQQRGHELSHMAQELAVAGGREVVEQFVTGGYKGEPQLQIPYRQFAERKDEDNFLKDYGNMKKESLMQAAFQLKDMGGAEGHARKRAIIKAAAANGYLDDILRMKEFAEKYGDADGTIYSAEVLNRFLFDYLGNNEQSKRFMAEDMEELGKKTKHFEYMGHAYYDTDKGTFVRGMEVVKGADGKAKKIKGLGKDSQVEQLVNTWQANYASSEFGKLGGRDRVSAAPHNLTTIRAELDAEGNIITDITDDGTVKTEGNQISHAVFGRKDGSMDTYSTKILKKMDADVMREIQHTQERVKHWILSKDGAAPDGTIMVESEEALQQIKEMYKINPEFVLGLYTKALGVKGDQWDKLGGIRYRVKKTEIVDGKVVEHHTVSADKGVIGNPKFESVESLRSTSEKKGSKASPAAEPANEPPTPPIVTSDEDSSDSTGPTGPT